MYSETIAMITKKEENLRVVSLLINIVMSQTMQLSNRMSKALAP